MTRRTSLGVLMSALALLVFSRTSMAAGAMTAGVARVEITPPVGHQLWGQASRPGPSTGVLDPLYARVLVLHHDGESLALVTLDLGRTFSQQRMADVRRRVREEAQVQHVIFSATHTHNGPAMLDPTYAKGVPNRWEPGVLDAIAVAIVRASRSASPCRLGTGRGLSHLGHNRVVPVGARRTGANETRLLTAPTDPVVQVLRVDDSQGKPLAVLANYAAHPVAVGMAHLTEYSADFPGAMCRYVEENLEDKPLALFLQGAAGDLNPPYLRAGAREVQSLGRELGREVVRVARAIRTGSPAIEELQVLDEKMDFRLRWNLEKLRSLGAIPTLHQWLTTGRPLGYPPPTRSVPITTVLINREIALATFAGEPYVALQLGFRARLPELTTFLAGYANGYFAYLPTIEEAVREGVHSGVTWFSVLEIGSAERLLDRAVMNVYRMLGRLKGDSASPPRPVRQAR